MSKTLLLVSTTVSATAMSIALLAQSPASPTYPGMSPGTVSSDQRQTSRPTMPDRPTTSGQTPQSEQQQEERGQQRQAVQAASVAAELTKRIDSKNAKVGDAVSAKTTTATKLPDGTDLPKGTTLVGKVTDVQAKAKGATDSHLAFSVEKAVLKDGKEVPLRAAVASMTAPSSNSAADVAPRSAPMPSGDSSGAGGGSASAGGGGMPSSATASMPMPSSDTSSQQAQGGTLKSSEDQVAVGNLPGVMLTGSNKPDSSGTLIASGKNISLESGTKMIIYLAVAG